MLAVFLILVGAVIVPCYSWGNWGSAGQWLSSQGSTAGIRWSQDLNPEVSDSPAPWTFYYLGCPIRNNYSGWFINNSVCQNNWQTPTRQSSPSCTQPCEGLMSDDHPLSQVGTWSLNKESCNLVVLKLQGWRLCSLKTPPSSSHHLPCQGARETYQKEKTRRAAWRRRQTGLRANLPLGIDCLSYKMGSHPVWTDQQAL